MSSLVGAVTRKTGSRKIFVTTRVRHLLALGNFDGALDDAYATVDKTVGDVIVTVDFDDWLRMVGRIYGKGR